MSRDAVGLDRRGWLLLGLIGALFLSYDVLSLAVFALGAERGYTDFLGQWSFGRFVWSHRPAEIYQEVPLRDFQREVEPGFGGYLPFPYPPHILLALAPLGALPILTARIVWLGLTGTAYLLAAGALAERRRALVVIGALLAPLTSINLMFGQTGYFTAALLCGGLALLPARPVLAGVLFGVLTCKPQLGILVPVALLAMRAWRAIGAAALTALALALVASLLLGWDMWPAWYRSLFTHVGLVQSGGGLNNRLMPTVLVGLLGLGVPPALAWAAQAAAFLAVAALVWRAHRRGPGTEAAAALVCGTFLATPYAFIYDMPAVSIVALAMLMPRLRAGAPLPVTDVALLLAGQMALAATSWGSGGSLVSALCVLLLFILAVIRTQARNASLPVPR